MSHLNIENFKFCLKFIAESSVKNANILKINQGRNPPPGAFYWNQYVDVP